MEALREKHIESILVLEDVERAKEAADPALHSLLQHEKEHFSKVKFSLLEVETKRRFLEMVLHGRKDSQEDKASQDSNKALLKETKKGCAAQLQKADETARLLGGRYEVCKQRSSHTGQLLAELEAVLKEGSEIREKDVLSLDYTLDELEQKNSEQQLRLKALGQLKRELSEKRKQLALEIEAKREKRDLLEQTKIYKKSLAEKRLNEKTKEEKTELLELKAWLVGGIRLASRLSGLRISREGAGRFAVQQGASSKIVEFTGTGKAISARCDGAALKELRRPHELGRLMRGLK